MRVLHATALVAFLGIVPLAEADVIQINFHGTGNAATSPNWNNVEIVQHASGGTTLPNLVNSHGVSTGVSLAIDEDNHFNSSGGTPNSHTFTGDAAAYFPDDVGGTYAWGQNGGFSGGPHPLTEIVFSGLDTNAVYDFTLLSWRATSGTTNRMGEFTIAGSNSQTVVINATNPGSDVTRILGIAPDTNGEILFSAITENNASNGYYYINGLVVEVIPEPASVALLGLGGLVMLSIRRRTKA